jgi:uncharacterized protein YegP (UPF0339 family)
MKFATVRYFEDKKGQWRWQLRAGNGKIVATGESHPRKRDAKRAYERVEALMSEARNADAGLLTARQIEQGAKHLLAAYIH